MAGGVVVNVNNNLDHDAPTEGTKTYAIIVCVFASLGGLFFGYDQGVTSSVLIMDSFLEDYCVGWHGFTYEDCIKSTSDLPDQWTDYTLWYNMSYNIGCIFGALLGGVVADKLGRRYTIFTAGVIFLIGTAWVSFNKAHEHGLMYMARIVQGVGVGNSSFSLPLFGAEMAPKEFRGFFAGFMQMTVVIGLFLANCVNIGVEDVDEGWRITNAVAMVPPIVVVCGIFFVPESPRWLLQHKGKEQALASLKKLRQTENVHVEFDLIAAQLAEEGDNVSYMDLLEPSILKRVIIAMALQVLQQATGINPIFSYGGLIFKDVTNAGAESVLMLSGVNFLSTIPAMRWVDTTGRRQLLLLGAVGMVLGHLLSAIVFTASCDGTVDDAGCPKGAGWIIVVGTAFFVFNFAISWGPVCWIYPAEIFPMKVRAKAVSLSTMANWLMGVAMTYVVKLFPDLNINGVFFLFAGTCCISGTFVYFLCPETKGILLEDIEYLFHKSGKKPGVSPQYVEVETPVQQA
ncbi:Sugar transport protein 10, partial [Globisporangium splendens]